MNERGFNVLTLRTRRNISLVLFIALLLISAGVWSMTTTQAGLQDGEYTGKAKGFKGDIVVDLTIAGGKITALSVRPHEDTPFIADPAIETLTKAILDTQGTEVDVVSGATYTSEAVIEAAEKALQRASGELKDGTYRGSAQGFASEITVEVTVAQGRIAKVEVVDHDDTPFIAQNAIDQIPAAVVDAQSFEVDAVSGATFTSNGIMNAVQDALGL